MMNPPWDIFWCICNWTVFLVLTSVLVLIIVIILGIFLGFLRPLRKRLVYNKKGEREIVCD